MDAAKNTITIPGMEKDTVITTPLYSNYRMSQGNEEKQDTSSYVNNSEERICHWNNKNGKPPIRSQSKSSADTQISVYQENRTSPTQQEKRRKASPVAQKGDVVRVTKPAETITFFSDDEGEDTEEIYPQEQRDGWNEIHVEYLTRNPEILLDVLRNWNIMPEQKRTETSSKHTREDETKNGQGKICCRPKVEQESQIEEKYLIDSRKLKNRRTPHDSLWKLWEEIDYRGELDTDSDTPVEMDLEKEDIISMEYTEPEMELEEATSEANLEERQAVLDTGGDEKTAKEPMDVTKNTVDIAERDNIEETPEQTIWEKGPNIEEYSESIPENEAKEPNILEREPAKPELCGNLLIEEIPGLTEAMHFAVAASLCNGDTETVICRAMNPTGEEIIIPQDSAVAKATILDRHPVISVIYPPEEEEEHTNDKSEIELAKKDQEDEYGLQSFPKQPKLKFDKEKENYDFHIDKDELNEDQQAMLLAFLQKHKDIFTSSDTDLGRTNLTEHKIDVGGAHPIKQRPYRIHPEKREKLREHINGMLEAGIIRPSNSPWASPVVLVDKPCGGIRFCVDFRKLNHITRKDSYPVPRIDESLDSLHGASFFSSLDLKSAYWQIAMEEKSRPYTAFTTYNGLYEFNVLPFGLANAGASFQTLMENILRDLQWKTCLIYIDDIVVFSSDFETHMVRLDEIFERIKTSGLKNTLGNATSANRN